MDNLAATLQQDIQHDPHEFSYMELLRNRLARNGDSTVSLGLESAMGILVIEKINLQTPVLIGISPENLKVGAGILEGSASIVDEGNTILTAHRSHINGRSFTRLPELEAGDRLNIITFEDHYRFEIYSKSEVGSDDVSILGGTIEGKTLTIFTGHPFNQANPPLRLVIKAKMTNPY